MPTRPATAKYMHPRASGAVKRASIGVSVDLLDAPDHVLQARVGDELVVHRLHRLLEGLLLDADDLRATGLDDLARFLLALVPELSHVRHRLLGRLADDLLVVRRERVP